jgi:hypothetical protein
MSSPPTTGRVAPTEPAPTAPRAPGPDPAPCPQWGEAYLLFDGEYRSLDDLLRKSDA